MTEFEKDGQRIIHGDAIEALEHSVEDNSVQLIFVDPPYNIGKIFNGKKEKDRWKSDAEYLNWCYQWLDLCIKKLTDNGSLYVMTSTQNMPYFDIYLRNRLAILSRIIWHYDSSGVQAKSYYGSLYEPILFCVKNKNNYIFNTDPILVKARTGADRKLIDYRKKTPSIYSDKKIPGNVWYIPRVRYRMPEYENHPTQKPETLLERIVLASSNPHDIVLDPFAGAFTTAAIAKKYGRRSISIESEEEYIKIGLRRIGIRSHYKGEKLNKEPRSFEKEKSSKKQTNLFEA